MGGPSLSSLFCFEEEIAVEGVLEFLVVAFQDDEGVAGSSTVVLFGIAVDVLEGCVAEFFFEAVFLQVIAEGIDKEGHGADVVAGEAVRFSLPGA